MKSFWLCLGIYTVSIFWFGLWCQTRIDTAQIRQLQDAAFDSGCKRCAQFEKEECQRDQLQGVEELLPIQ